MEDNLRSHIKKFSYGCFQTALLYTSNAGQRRIRVHTVAVPVASELSQLYNAADAEAIVALLAKMGVEKGTESSLDDARAAVLNSCSDITKAFCTNFARAGNLSLSESLKLLPYYSLSMVKSRMFRVEGCGSIDMRSFWLTLGRTLPTHLLCNLFSPRLFRLQPGDVRARELSPCLPLSAASLKRDHVLMLDNCRTLWIYFGREVPPPVIDGLFGFRSFDQIDTASVGCAALVTIIAKSKFARWAAAVDPIG